MQEIVSTVTQRGQVTIPAAVRRLLGTKPRDKVAFQIDGGEVRLVQVKYTLESAYGSVKPLQRPTDFKEQSRIARDQHAARSLR